MAYLELHRNGTHFIDYPLRGQRILIGRSDTCDILIPLANVSRTHAIISLENERWWVVDRCSHGTMINGEYIDSKRNLSFDDNIQMGEFSIFFRKSGGSMPSTTDKGFRLNQPVETLVSFSDELAVERLYVSVVKGKKKLPFLIQRSKTTIGATGSDFEIEDDKLLADHIVINVSRGRAMVSPGEGAGFLNGTRIISTTPINTGEEISIGDSVITISSAVNIDDEQIDSFGSMVTVGGDMKRKFGALKKMAAHSAPVLLMGETGTGKELAAFGLHKEGPRKAGPFIAINCSAIAKDLFESELFGHEKGAFTGATSQKDGAFQNADQGTLFLDELGELPLEAQAKLLRVLESGEVRRVGSTSTSFPDVRVVAATNKDLTEEVASGRFRQDLFFRLAVLGVELPPLRERLEDLPVITDAISKKISPKITVSDGALAILAAHSFPGNFRELRNIITRAFVLHGPLIMGTNLTFNLKGNPSSKRFDTQREKIDVAEAALLRDLHKKYRGNHSAIARELGMARSTISYKIKRYDIQ